jgi:hypothetical protein
VASDASWRATGAPCRAASRPARTFTVTPESHGNTRLALAEFRETGPTLCPTPRGLTQSHEIRGFRGTAAPLTAQGTSGSLNPVNLNPWSSRRKEPVLQAATWLNPKPPRQNVALSCARYAGLSGILRWSFATTFVLLLALPSHAQGPSDVLIFYEDDPTGSDYYDASIAWQTNGSTLVLRGEPAQKLPVQNVSSYTGQWAAWIEWYSAPGGFWQIRIAGVGRPVRSIVGQSNLVLYVNGPSSIPAVRLPRVRLVDATGRQTTLLALGDYLPAGLDDDSNTWQRIAIPLRQFGSGEGFDPGQFQWVSLESDSPDDRARTLWVDNVRFTTRVELPGAPVRLVAYGGDESVVVHWDPPPESGAFAYRVLGADTLEGPWVRLGRDRTFWRAFADVHAPNGRLRYYRVVALDPSEQEGAPSEPVSAMATPFRDDEAFLDYLQRASFAFFWYESNPTNGLVKDRSTPTSPCSIAAVGFGLTAWCIGADRGWITREQARARALAALRTFAEAPQGTNRIGTIGYRGWFYHFLDMTNAVRFSNSELSSIDTALLLAGVLYAREYFDGEEPEETEIRQRADALLDRVDWTWMLAGRDSLSMGWRPETGFLTSRWIGYNEAMILYLLGLGARSNALPEGVWGRWVSGYRWRTNYGYAYVEFAPLFGHQYSHCWVDFRYRADAFMAARGLTYFENSRRATLAQQAYAMANPRRHPGYGATLWGFTACDGPGFGSFLGYAARGAPPPENDDGTIAPTAPGGSLPFAPEACLPTLRHLYDRYRRELWTGYGFRDAFNLAANWWGPDVLGIDQGPIVLMIENYRTGNVWRRFMKSEVIRHGLDRAGFRDVPSPRTRIQIESDRSRVLLRWNALPGFAYQVLYSPDLGQWRQVPTGPTLATEPEAAWEDSGPPGTEVPPASVPARFYLVRTLGVP